MVREVLSVFNDNTSILGVHYKEVPSYIHRVHIVLTHPRAALIFHSLIELSKPLDDNIVPSELKDNEDILEVWPLNSIILCDDDISHKVMVPSLPINRN